MKRINSLIALSLVLGSALLVSCGGAPKAPKGFVLQEGDRATVTNVDGYTTIEFPAELNSQDMALYQDDFVSYMIKSNCPLSTDGNQWGSYNIYYYLHNSKDWLYQGKFSSPQELNVSDMKSIKFANVRKRLREFNTLMPFLDQSTVKKSDDNYINEVRMGENYYIMVDITLRD